MKMIKTTFTLFIVFAMLFISCDEIETSDLTLDQTKQATVRAYIYAELDRTSLGTEFAPNGTKVVVSIPNSQFTNSMLTKAGPAPTNGYWRDTATVNNGLIEITVPATDIGVDVSFYAAEFTYDQVQSFGSNSTTVPKLYTQDDSYSISDVKTGETRTEQVYYEDNDLDYFTETVNRNFIASAITDVDAGSQFVPSGTVINVYSIGDFSTTSTVGTGGTFSVTIPKNVTVSFRFEATKTLAGGTETENWRYTIEDYDSYSESSPTAENINFGDGEKWE